MRPWLQIPTKTRMGLLREYKKMGYSYNQAINDFETSLPKYEEGGEIEKPQTSETFSNLAQNLGTYFLNTPHTGRIKATYSPTVSINKNAEYYTYPNLKNDVLKDLKSDITVENINTQQNNFKMQKEEYAPQYIKNKTFEEYYNYLNNSPKSGRLQGSSINLGKYKVSAGKDEKGRYISIYDKYDWNLLEQLGVKGNSWEIYDRIYENEF